MGRAKWRILHAPHGAARHFDAKAIQRVYRVLLATVLLITAIGQHFHFKAVRFAFMILACLLLCLPLLQLLMLPRI